MKSARAWNFTEPITKKMRTIRFGYQTSAKGWVIVSQDQFNELERRAIRNAGGRAFLIVQGSRTGDETSRMVVAAMPKILRILKANPAPFIAKIYKAKRVEILSTKFRAHSKLSA
jgi:hypothetical protein